MVPLTELDDELVARWRALAASTAEPNPYYEPELVLPAARHLGARDLQLLLVQDGTRATFALPVARSRRSFHPSSTGALRAWEHDYCFLGTPLLARDRGDVAWAVALQTLREERREWRLDIDQFPPDGPVANHLRAATSGEWATSTTRARSRAAVRKRSEPSYLDGRLRGTNRKSLRRRRRRLAERLGSDLEVIDRASGHDWASAVEEFIRLEASGWKARQGGAFAARGGHTEFFRELCGNLHAVGRLQLLALQSSGRPVAMACNLIGRDTLFRFKIAYDEALAEFSPGLQLELDALAMFHADPRLVFIDSCADPRSPMANRLFPDTRPLVRQHVALRGALSGALVRTLPAASGARETVAAVKRAVAARVRRETISRPGAPGAESH